QTVMGRVDDADHSLLRVPLRFWLPAVAGGLNRLAGLPGKETDGWAKRMRPVVTVYSSPALPNGPSCRRPLQTLRSGPSSPAEPAVLRQPIPQPFRAGPRNLTAPE